MIKESSSKLIKLVVWNANGIKYKINDFELFLDKYKIDIAIVTETKLFPTDRIKINS